jgi:hypothetical protein
MRALDFFSELFDLTQLSYPSADGAAAEALKFPRGVQFGVTIVRVARAYATQGQLHKRSLIYVSILSLINTYPALCGVRWRISEPQGPTTPLA